MKRSDRMTSSLDDEIREHIACETQDNLARGMAPDAARLAAVRKFGNVSLVMEDTRSVWTHLWLDEFLHDIRYGLRMLRRSPGFTAIAILTLALGIGANTAIFSLLNAVMLQSLPVRDPQQLVALRWSANHRPNSLHHSSYGDCQATRWEEHYASSCSYSYSFVRELRKQTNLFSGVAAFAGPADLNLSGNGTAAMVNGEFVSGDYFQTLGVGAAAGRVLIPSDEAVGAEPVAVLDYSYWQTAFGGLLSAIGKPINLNGTPFTIVGVADPGFTHLTPGKSQNLWIPISHIKILHIPWTDESEKSGSWGLTVMGRIPESMPLAQAESGASLFFRNQVLQDKLFKPEDDPRMALLPAQHGLVGVRSAIQEPLYILMAAVGFLLLISGANVAGLMLSRAATRQREMAVRLALGAGRARLTRQLLTESLMLSFAGAALGILIAHWGAHALARFFVLNRYSQARIETPLSLPVLLFAVAVAAITGILFGLAPAFRASGVNVAPALKETTVDPSGVSSRGRRRFTLGGGLVVAQVALSVIVLVGTGLVLRTLSNLKNLDPGFDTHNVLQFAVDPKLTGTYKDEQIQPLHSEITARLSALPGVHSVTYSSQTLLDGGLWTSDMVVEGRPDRSRVEIQMLSVGPSFFETMRIPLLRGRPVTASDIQSKRQIAVVNHAFVEKLLNGRDPLGLHFGGGEPGDKHYEIVGIAGDIRYDSLRSGLEPTAFVPRTGGGATYFSIKTAAAPETLLPSVRAAVSDLDNNLPLFDVRTQSQRIDRLLFSERLLARLSTLFGLLALVLSCIGVYGLLAYEVARRTREIGIRSALGALKSDLLRMIAAQGLVLVLVGLVFGIVSAVFATRSLGSLLYGVRPFDPATLLSVSALLLLVALTACWLPARRAARVDPMVALRCD